MSNEYTVFLTEAVRIRAREIERYIPDEPFCICPSADDREKWEALKQNPAISASIKEAEAIISKPIEHLTEELYLAYSKTGQRTECEFFLSAQLRTLRNIFFAECLEDKGRFLPRYEEMIRSICAQRTWLLPAHDVNLDNYFGRRQIIDLHSTNMSWTIAAMDYILSDRVSADVRKLISDNIFTRTLNPFTDMISGKAQCSFWFHVESNWNACCMSGILGAALALVPSKAERAVYIAMYEKLVQNYIDGFPADGYCGEGIHYWGYGFSHYIAGTELVRRCTGGHVDLFMEPQIRNIALFGFNLEMTDGCCPSFADSAFGEAQQLECMYYVCKRLGINEEKWLRNEKLHINSSYLYEILLYLFWDESADSAEVKEVSEYFSGGALRHFFDDAQVLICRTDESKGVKLSAAIKGGHNNEPHNHNDVGSFVAAVNGEQLIVDPGVAVYEEKTFASGRYDIDILGSYGHNVPVVAGEAQLPHTFDEYIPGISPHAAKVAETRFGTDTDEITFDLAEVYPPEPLTELQRKYTFDRRGIGALTVSDSFAFSEPQDFETAVMTYGKVEVIEGAVVITGEKNAVSVEITDCACDISLESIKGAAIDQRTPSDRPLTRVSFKPVQRRAAGTVTMKVTPYVK